MGFFDIFRKNQGLTPDSIIINATDKGMHINGSTVTLPCNVQALEKLLGKSRMTAYDAQRINCTWDELGIYCYTIGGSVDCIGVQHRVRLQVAHTPASLFRGTLMINGCPWHEIVRKGTDMEAYRRVDIGGYSVISEYADFSRPEGLGNADDYSGIEFQLKK